LYGKVGGVVVVLENSHEFVEEKTAQNDIVALNLVSSQALDLNQASCSLIDRKSLKRNKNVVGTVAREVDLE
jgi:hypothetical protein